MSNFESRVRLAKDGEGLQRTELLLERYPDIDDEQARLAADYLKNAAALDLGLLSANRQAWAAVEALKHDRPDLFRSSFQGLFVGALVVAVSLLIVIWLGHAGMNL